MKITPEYIELNRALHEAGHYGISGARWAAEVLGVCKSLDSRDVLDYGCGQRTLEKALGFRIHNYDPCIPGLEAPAAPADLVVCTDVLEHIEPECIDEVLDDLQRVVRKIGMFAIATGPARKSLPDGRNAHLIQQPLDWWVQRFEKRFKVLKAEPRPKGEFLLIVGALRKAAAP